MLVPSDSDALGISCCQPINVRCLWSTAEVKPLAEWAAIAANLTTVSLAKFLKLASRVVLSRVQCGNGLATISVAVLAGYTATAVFVAPVSVGSSFHIVYNTP